MTKAATENASLATRLAEREELLASITANMPGVVYQFYAREDGEWGMYLVSPKAQEIFGISGEDEGFVQRFIGCLPEEDRMRFAESISDSVKREAPFDFEGRFIRPDGKEIFFQARSIPRKNGRELIFDGLLLDITGQRNAEQEREEQARILGAITANLPGVVYEFFTDIDGSMGMHYVSERAQEIFGIPSTPEFFVERFVACLPERDRQAFIESIQRVVKLEIPWHYSGDYVRPDGVMVHFRGDSVPSRRRGRLVFHGLLLDLTEQRRMEEIVHHSQKMDSIGQLAGGVAHDFNNMLSGIMGAAELLEDQLHDDLPSAELARLILSTAERAGELTRQLLAFSRKGNRVKKPRGVHSVLQATIKMLERSIDPRVRIECRFGATADTVLADPSHLQAAFVNLAVNARDAMPSGGLLTFETSDVGVFPGERASDLDLAPGEYLSVRVSDTGAGIPDDVRQRVFEPFFTTKPVGQGTGMGLAAVYGTTADHHGSITIVETSSRGTCFEMLLPLVSEGNPESASIVRAVEARAHGRVLVIDDEDVVRTVAQKLVESLGYTVTMAADPLVALEAFRVAPEAVDVVILDMMMPQLSGEQVFFKLREIRSDLPVILCSGYALDQAVIRLREKGLAGHLKKPFRRDELRDVLRRALAEPRPASDTPSL